MRIILDATALRLYPVGKPGFHGGTELYVKELAKGLSQRHTVHVVTPDLEAEEQRGPNEWWWGEQAHPTQADAVVMVHSLANVAPYSADFLIYATNGIDPMLGPNHEMASGIDAFPVFSQKHADLLMKARPTVKPEQCFVTGLGVNIWEFGRGAKGMPTRTEDFSVIPTPGRMLYANDPARGLWHVLDIFDLVKAQVPHATLHVAYDFNRQFEPLRWQASHLAELMWDCKRRIESTEGVVNLGSLSSEHLVREQLQCQVHVMPSDPPNVGSQIHGITQMECAAAGAALVLSDTEAFPEVFGEAATILGVPGTYIPQVERRVDVQDWADVVVELMQDSEKWQAASQAARALAEQNTWAHVIERWEQMLATLAAGERVAA